MKKTLLDHPEAKIAAEYCPYTLASNGKDGGNVLNFLVERGYQPYELTRRALAPWNPAQSDGLRKRGYTDVLFMKS